MSDLRFGKAAEEHLGELVEQFRKNLSMITRRLAYHERAETVDKRHVANAFEALVRCGLDRTPWWQRPQLKITISGAIVGFAFAVPDFAPLIVEDKAVPVVSWSCIVVLMFAALLIYGWGWAQNSA